MIFLDSDCLLQVCLSYISANVATFLIQPILLYILQINKENIPPIDIQPIFKCDFCSFLAKITLKLNSCMFLLDLCCMDVPMLVFAAWLVQELARVVPELIAVVSERSLLPS